MSTNPYHDEDAHGALQQRLKKSDSIEQSVIDGVVQGHIAYARSSGASLPPGAKVLDFGCGVGASVQALLELGYDAYGVDVVELWGKDFDQYWHDRKLPADTVRSRLFKVDVSNYKLPFADDTFDFCFSDQVFEHVFNYQVVFQELARVLKPGAFSAHRFPGPNCPTEAHISVPFIPLCRFPWYLKLWAMVGRRSLRQQGLDWKATLQSNQEMMRFCNYPSKKALRRHARSAGVKIEFDDAEGIRFSGIGRAYSLYQYTKSAHVDRPALAMLKLISQRYMIIHAG